MQPPAIEPAPRPGLEQRSRGGQKRDDGPGGDRIEVVPVAEDGQEAHPRRQGGRARPEEQDRLEERRLADPADELDHSRARPAERCHPGHQADDGEGGDERHRAEHGEEQPVAAGHHERPAYDRAEQVADALGAAVAAEEPAGPLLAPEGGDRRASGGGERGSSRPLGEAGGAEEVRVATDGKRGRGEPERDEPSDHHLLRPPAVDHGAEHGLQDHLRSVVHAEDEPELEERVVTAEGVGAEVGGDGMGPEGGNEPGPVDGEDLPATGGLLARAHGRTRAS